MQWCQPACGGGHNLHIGERDTKRDHLCLEERNWSPSGARGDYPELIVPPILAGRKKGEPAEEAEASAKSRPDSGSDEILQERWQLTHGRDPPAWADKGFVGIKEHMRQRATAAEGSIKEVTLYCPQRNPGAPTAAASPLGSQPTRSASSSSAPLELRGRTGHSRPCPS